jgi:hypothetical protein
MTCETGTQESMQHAVPPKWVDAWGKVILCMLCVKLTEGLYWCCMHAPLVRYLTVVEHAVKNGAVAVEGVRLDLLLKALLQTNTCTVITFEFAGRQEVGQCCTRE